MKPEEETSSGDSMRQPDALYDAAAHTRKQQISVSGIFVFGWGIGVGARYSLPLVKDGFLAEFNDSFEVDFGVDLAFSTFGWAVGSLLVAAAEPRWTFHVLPNIDAYVKLGLLLQFPLGGGVGYPPVWPAAAIGGMYKLTPALWARLELSNFGTRLGVGYDF
jgi:hypothetical protein